VRQRIYPMGPILAWANFCGFAFDMALVKRVERLGRDIATWFGLETA
jgi:hypothetical protein